MSERQPGDKGRQNQPYLQPPNPFLNMQTQFQNQSQVANCQNFQFFVQSQLLQPFLQNSPKTISDTSLQLFNNMKDIIYRLSNQKLSKMDEIADQSVQKQLQQTKIVNSLKHQICHYKELLSSSQKKLKQTQQTFEKNYKQTQAKHRKQIKKYVEIINQKQNEVQSLKKSVNSLNSRCLSLTQQIQSLTQVKYSLENNILKTIQNVKSNFKQFNYSLEQNQSEKVILQAKYKQLCDKIQIVVKQSQESQNEKNRIEKKYTKLRENYENVKDECVQLKFQIQRYKVKLRDLSNTGQSKQRKPKNYQAQPICQTNPKSSKQRILSPIIQSITPQQTLIEIKQKSAKILQKIQSLSELTAKTQTINNLNKKIVQVVKQNDALRLELCERSIEVDELRYKLEGAGYEDELIKIRKPSLYELLVEKKNNIQNLENKIIEIQKIAYNVQELLLKRAQPTNIQISEFPTESITGNQNLQKQKQKYRKQIYEQLYTQFQQEKDKAIAKQRQIQQKINLKSNKIIRQLEDANSNSRKEIQKLKAFIQEIQKEKRKYKGQILEMTQQINALNQNKKKKNPKTKNKLKCVQCEIQFANSFKNTKCLHCGARVHPQCMKIHICKEKDREKFQQSNTEQSQFFEIE